jgi:hypothetical protein
MVELGLMAVGVYGLAMTYLAWRSCRFNDVLRQDNIDACGLIQRQGELLRGVANALKGPPPELTTWSHHDLPEVAAELKAKVQELETEVESLESQMDGG